MLPVKKRFSSSDAKDASSESSRAPKRASVVSLEDDELELLRLKRDLAFQRLQAASSRFSPSAGLSNNGMPRMPFTFAPNVISPEAYAMPFSSNMLTASSAPRPPFPARRASECIDLTKEPESKRSPLDLLSSVSTVVARSERRNSCPTNSSIVAVAANQQDPAGVMTGGEKYLGERDPTTGCRHGKGIMKYSNGCRYVGFFVNDRREGYGKCWYPNGCVYAGQWKGNQRHGKGTMTYMNGEVYEGSWEEDQRHGSGVYHWKDGRADVCKFHRQKIVGDGCRWNPKRQSVWLLRDGEMVMESPVSVEFGMEMAKKLGVQFP
ncbi:hypothetical protein ACHAXN_002269 [Cyclotella atomus]